MPKAPSTSSNGRPALRRNQACRTCRKRKLKCDAARPHCGTCVKQWQATISVPAPVGYAHPTEPQCSYDPIEGLTLAPDTDPIEKIKQLEDQITQLKNRLYEQGGSNRSITPSSDSANMTLPRASLAMNLIAPETPESRLRSETGSPDATAGKQASSGDTDPFMDLLFSGWNPDLPEPSVLDHYIDVFFKCDPCGSRVLHKPSFLAAMKLTPKDPDFPHSAILHAICASASRWYPQNVITLPDSTRRDQFAEFHASKTRQYIDKTMASGEDIFSVMQACILLSWYFYQEGRWVEVWIFAGFQTRVAVPLRLNYPGTFSTHGNNSPGAYLAPPNDLRDLESRRRTWWMTILFDRIASVGGWIHAVDERDLGTELPLRTEDFESGRQIPSNTQHLGQADVYTRHPPQYTDSFLLLIKAVMLFGKVTDFNVRGNLRAPTAPSKNQNPFSLAGFKELDQLVCEDFIANLPQIFRTNNGVTQSPDGGSTLDTDLYMVHIIPHAATITLHNPYIDFADPSNISMTRCVNSAKQILNAFYTVSQASLDITRLHPFVTICWYLAAVVLVQLCKHYIETDEQEKEARIWGEINVLRFAMLEYGSRSPIGTRQERLLQGLMREIVRMTAQKHPLEVSVPMYPFSHRSLFQRDDQQSPIQRDAPNGQPSIPNNVTAMYPTHQGTSSGSERTLSPPNIHRQANAGPPSWPIRDLSQSPHMDQLPNHSGYGMNTGR
ncbi:nuclear protein [Coprinopsis cinerea AmutBmut pab1-1]|nr:nuclear protein [Coprinopsis cinerea AmutBmut pab1-1]